MSDWGWAVIVMILVVIVLGQELVYNPIIPNPQSPECPKDEGGFWDE